LKNPYTSKCVALSAAGVDVRRIVEQFGQGFYEGSDTTVSVTIGIGTNNSIHSGVGAAAGTAFGATVNTVNQWFGNHGAASFPMSEQVSAFGAMDFESNHDFCSNDDDPTCTTKARQWATAFSQTATGWAYFNYGDCAGCPPFGSVPSNGWTMDDYVALSWGISGAFPFPEIYTPNGANAAEWERVSERSVATGRGKLGFFASLTQSGQCAAHPSPTCNGTDASPSLGWHNLYNNLNGVGYEGHVAPPSVFFPGFEASDIILYP
jgi:hypothetical protein